MKCLVLATLTILSAFASVTRAQTCRPIFTEERVAHIAINGRVITVIGWEHPVDDDWAILRPALTNAHHAAQIKDCAAAAKHLSVALQKQTENLINSRTVTRQLKETHRANPVHAVGLEMTPEEWPEVKEQLAYIVFELDEIKITCPQETQSLVTMFKEVIPGPEHPFAKTYQATLLPLEDKNVKDPNFAQVENPERAAFNFEDPRITDAGKRAATEMERLSHQSRQIPFRLLNEVISFETNLNKRAEMLTNLRRVLAANALMMDGVIARNKAIVSNLMLNQGNIAVVIGYAHLDDMMRQLTRTCEEQRRGLR